MLMTPKSTTINVSGASAYAANTLDIATLTGKYAKYIHITNNLNNEVQIKLNGDADCVFTLASDGEHTLTDFIIEKVQVDNTGSGSGSGTVTVFYGV